MKSRTWTLLCLFPLLEVGCSKPPGPQAPNTSAHGPGAEVACVDKWLAEHHLDTYGHPEGTAYAGGTPLFDERTGKTQDRLEYVYAQQPKARKACAPPAP